MLLLITFNLKYSYEYFFEINTKNKTKVFKLYQ